MSQENLHIDVTVDDGKYRFTQDTKGHVEVYRHGEPWINGSFTGINMVIAMACELEDLRGKHSDLRTKYGELVDTAHRINDLTKQLVEEYERILENSAPSASKTFVGRSVSQS